MSKAANTSASRMFRITVSEQSSALLEQLAAKGIYGRNAADVAGRFVDSALQRLVETDRLIVPRAKALSRRRS
jgi:hypothetical protein